MITGLAVVGGLVVFLVLIRSFAQAIKISGFEEGKIVFTLKFQTREKENPSKQIAGGHTLVDSPALPKSTED
jgi:hypothetical protein